MTFRLTTVLVLSCYLGIILFIKFPGVLAVSNREGIRTHHDESTPTARGASFSASVHKESGSLREDDGGSSEWSGEMGQPSDVFSISNVGGGGTGGSSTSLSPSPTSTKTRTASPSNSPTPSISSSKSRPHTPSPSTSPSEGKTNSPSSSPSPSTTPSRSRTPNRSESSSMSLSLSSSYTSSSSLSPSKSRTLSESRTSTPASSHSSSSAHLMFQSLSSSASRSESLSVLTSYSLIASNTPTPAQRVITWTSSYSTSLPFVFPSPTQSISSISSSPSSSRLSPSLSILPSSTSSASAQSTPRTGTSSVFGAYSSPTSPALSSSTFSSLTPAAHGSPSPFPILTEGSPMNTSRQLAPPVLPVSFDDNPLSYSIPFLRYDSCDIHSRTDPRLISRLQLFRPASTPTAPFSSSSINSSVPAHGHMSAWTLEVDLQSSHILDDLRSALLSPESLLHVDLLCVNASSWSIPSPPPYEDHLVTLSLILSPMNPFHRLNLLPDKRLVGATATANTTKAEKNMSILSAALHGGEVMVFSSHKGGEGSTRFQPPWRWSGTTTVSASLLLPSGALLSLNTSMWREDAEAVYVSLPSYRDACFSACGFDLCRDTSPSMAFRVTLAFEGGWLPTASQSDSSSPPFLAAHTKGGGNISFSLSFVCPGHCSAQGLVYTEKCPGYETGGACLIPNANCAFRKDGVCMPCSEGAICPGGVRRWPVRGYWMKTERSVDLIRCSSPSDRCLGWDRRAGKPLCGEKFRGPGCGSCAAGFFTSRGSCASCPSESLVAVFWDRVGLVAAGVVGIVSLFWFFVLILLSRYNVPQPYRRATVMVMDLIEWILVVVQQLAQVARLSAPGLPRAWVRFSELLQLARFDAASVVPPECAEDYPFALYVTSLCVGLVAVSWVAVSLVLERPLLGKGQASASWRRCRGGSLQVSLGAASLLFSLTVMTSITVLNCMKMDGAYRWAGQMVYTCYTGAHRPVAVLAWVCVVGVGCGLPVLLLCGSRRLIKSTTGASGCEGMTRLSTPVHRRLRRVRRWSPVFSHGQAWFRPMTLLILFLTAALDLPAERPVEATDLVVACKYVTAGTLTVFGLVSFALKPQHEMIRWQRWPDLLINLLSALVACVQASFTRDDVVHGEVTLTSRAQLWVAVGLTSFLPLVLLGSYSAWLMGVLGVRCCAWAVHRRGMSQGDMVRKLMEETSKGNNISIGTVVDGAGTDEACGGVVRCETEPPVDLKAVMDLRGMEGGTKQAGEGPTRSQQSRNIGDPDAELGEGVPALEISRALGHADTGSLYITTTNPMVVFQARARRAEETAGHEEITDAGGPSRKWPRLSEAERQRRFEAMVVGKMKAKIAARRASQVGKFVQRYVEVVNREGSKEVEEDGDEIG